MEFQFTKFVVISVFVLGTQLNVLAQTPASTNRFFAHSPYELFDQERAVVPRARAAAILAEVMHRQACEEIMANVDEDLSGDFFAETGMESELFDQFQRDAERTLSALSVDASQRVARFQAATREYEAHHSAENDGRRMDAQQALFAHYIRQLDTVIADMPINCADRNVLSVIGGSPQELRQEFNPRYTIQVNGSAPGNSSRHQYREDSRPRDTTALMRIRCANEAGDTDAFGNRMRNSIDFGGVYFGRSYVLSELSSPQSGVIQIRFCQASVPNTPSAEPLAKCLRLNLTSGELRTDGDEPLVESSDIMERIRIRKLDAMRANMPECHRYWNRAPLDEGHILMGEEEIDFSQYTMQGTAASVSSPEVAGASQRMTGVVSRWLDNIRRNPPVVSGDIQDCGSLRRGRGNWFSAMHALVSERLTRELQGSLEQLGTGAYPRNATATHDVRSAMAAVSAGFSTTDERLRRCLDFTNSDIPTDEDLPNYQENYCSAVWEAYSILGLQSLPILVDCPPGERAQCQLPFLNIQQALRNEVGLNADCSCLREVRNSRGRHLSDIDVLESRLLSRDLAESDRTSQGENRNVRVPVRVEAMDQMARATRVSLDSNRSCTEISLPGLVPTIARFQRGITSCRIEFCSELGLPGQEAQAPRLSLSTRGYSPLACSGSMGRSLGFGDIINRITEELMRDRCSPARHVGGAIPGTARRRGSAAH